jgi:hypothetical protein
MLQMLASDKCYQLALALQVMSTKISCEDARTAANSLFECVTNVLTVRAIRTTLRLNNENVYI